MEKDLKKVCIYMNESLGYTPETNTTLYINCT